MDSAVTAIYLPELKLFKRGKVRDVFDLGEYYLIVSTDRLSAFDVIMNEGIPAKGKILNRISGFWFEHVNQLVENHLISMNVNEYPEVCSQYKDLLLGRSMLVKKAELIPIECIVRGYISGTGWNDYKKDGRICGIELPQGLVESEKLPQPIFTPSTKAEVGLHDENINEQQAIDIIGAESFHFIKETALKIYYKAAEFALTKGIIIADTKMEFGYYRDKIILIDELLTPDSSRFWPLSGYEKGRAQNSFDKQYVRDYLLSINFDKKPPAPALPQDVIRNTAKKYEEALFKLTGDKLS
ncbi:MAG: phosphoribosylaminoimidazole-succinocarboxamide synthase [Ignavibacteria bacterium]|nr:MAG: phosphoribosylaminoimidazole-succinocarboxamide synthase [Ignavibacteria bacterium]KAF0159938.1 MAG: phosphoribosylaminoimidazole-succinocarboxamide synthase [Ignavibacteria bacterium]